MIVPFASEESYRLRCARRKRIEAIVKAKGIDPRSNKFLTLVGRMVRSGRRYGDKR